ncbi:alpha/beta hydrolase [Lacticaseibacillus pantheris]|uniref:alpha/beta hydrolase n=1 Tax=Lacticaseibacillus pantheris TaxID=171523 RepID=UPI0006D17388|nr:alpha/beta hydrolase [Lacticaseibacillus pantheris]
MTSIERDVQYDERLDLRTDLYPATTTEQRGTVLLIHGGGWFRGDKSKETKAASIFADAGYQVVVPNFRLAPDYLYPAPLVDMDSLVTWLRQSGRIDDHVAVVGASSGGNMSVEVGLKYGWPAVSLSGIINIEEWLAAHPDVVGTLAHQRPLTLTPRLLIRMGPTMNSTRALSSNTLVLLRSTTSARRTTT